MSKVLSEELTSAEFGIERFKKKSFAKETWKRLIKNKPALISFVVLCSIVLVAIFADFIANYNTLAIRQNIGERLQAPSAAHWFGTDSFGRDVFARIVHGARISLLIGLVVTAVSLAIGSFLGAIAAYFQGVTDTILMRFIDMLMCVPPILFSMAIISALGTDPKNMMIALIVSYSPTYARIIRAAMLPVVGMEYIEAARASGSGNLKIILRHLFPNAIGPIIIQGTMAVGAVILTAASLSFLGLGVQAPTPEWGVMISESRTLIRTYPYLIIFPGLSLVITVLSVNLLGDGLRDALDPKLKD